MLGENSSLRESISLLEEAEQSISEFRLEKSPLSSERLNLSELNSLLTSSTEKVQSVLSHNSAADSIPPADSHTASEATAIAASSIIKDISTCF